MCDEQETSAIENSKSELNIINKCSRLGQKGKKLSLTTKGETDVGNQRIKTGPDGTLQREIDVSPKPSSS